MLIMYYTKKLFILFEKLFKILKRSTQSHGNKLSAFTKWELTIITKRFVIKLVLIPILTCGHGFWEMTERILSQLQAAEMGFFRKVHSVKLAIKCAAVKFTKLRMSNHFPSKQKDLSYDGSSTWPECLKKVLWGESCWLPMTKRAGGGPRTTWRRGYISHLALPNLLWSQLGPVLGVWGPSSLDFGAPNMPYISFNT